MATKLALVSFQFLELDDIRYDEALDYNFCQSPPLPGEALQPVVAEAVARIKQCLGSSVSSMFRFGSVRILNLSNVFHMATLFWDAKLEHSDNREATTGMIVTCKFIRLDPGPEYTVSIDIEEMPSTLVEPSSRHAYQTGLGNKQIEQLVGLLDEAFLLNGRIESIPIIKRGRTQRPHYLVSSDDRMMEYDFNETLYHEKSEFQDIKIVGSPSLGNTLLLDNLQNLAEADLNYTYALMDRGQVSYGDKEVLILGGGDGGLLWELLKERPKFVTMAEIDQMVIEACRDHMRPCGEAMRKLAGPNYRIIVDDCLKVLRQSIADGKRFDVIFNDLTDIPVTKRRESLTAFDSSAVQKDNPWHFIEVIFNLSLDCLAPGGLYMNHATGKGNTKAVLAYEEFLAESRTQVDYEKREAYVPSFMEVWLFYTIRKRQQQQQRG